MWSFLTGLGSAALFALGTLWVLEVGTVTMIERSDDRSTRLEDLWQGDAQREGMIPETSEHE